jgi:hypothetical protein
MSKGEENNNMTSQAQALVLEETDQQSSVEVRFDKPASANHIPVDHPPTDSPIDEEQQYRASAYALIAALLRAVPDQQMLDRLDGLSQETTTDGDELLLAICRQKYIHLCRSTTSFIIYLLAWAGVRLCRTAPGISLGLCRKSH